MSQITMAATDWLTRQEASDYLRTLGCMISHRTLENMACNNNAGKGPPFTRSGWRTVAYQRSDLDKWAKSRIEKVE